MNSRKKKQFIEAYDKHAEEIYRYCFFRVFSKETAEDLVQETFIKVWNYLQNGHTVEAIRPFLYQVSRNLIIDLHNKRKRFNERELDEFIQKKEAASFSYDNRQKIEQDDLLAETLKTLKLLPKSQREVILLRYMENLPPREIAALLNDKSKNISAKIARAKKNLDKILKREAQTSDSLKNNSAR